MRLQVFSYSGYTAGERPLRFILDGREYRVVELLDRWYAPGDTWFRVRASDGNVYVLRHRLYSDDDPWSLEAYADGRAR